MTDVLNLRTVQGERLFLEDKGLLINQYQNISAQESFPRGQPTIHEKPHNSISS